MPLLPIVLGALLSQLPVAQTRFQKAAPLPSIPPVTIDSLTAGVGLAAQMARGQNLQARILWIDGTANIERVNDEDKVTLLVAQIKKAGFNTIVFDVKPISGQVLYNSKIAPKISEWRGQTLPADFDPLAVMSRQAKAQGLSLFVSLNAFSEGHSMFKVGPGYGKPDWQTVLYEGDPVVASPGGATYRISSPFNRFPDETGSLALFSEVKKLPPPKEGNFAVSLDRHSEVVDGFEWGGVGKGVPTVPTGGCILLGSGGGAAFLQVNATPGTKLTLKTLPNYVPISERPEQQYPLIVNPNNPDVQDYEISIAREVVGNYAVDGILYDDRFRYAGLSADFSETTRRAFEKVVGKPLAWPDEVFKYTVAPNGARGIEPGPYFDAWMAWRPFVMKQFLWSVRNAIKQVRKDVQLGLYVGSWYGEYPSLGENYASPDLDAGFWFLTKEYKRSGNAPLLDLMITGCYYPTATIFEAMGSGTSPGATVESAGTLSNRVARDQTWVYAGLSLEQFKNNPEGLKNALQAACASTQGVMVFDLSHDIEPMWPVFEQAFAVLAKAPHQAPGLLNRIRLTRANLDKRGIKEPVVVIQNGIGGTGQ